MELNESLNQVIAHLRKGNLGEALSEMETFMLAYPQRTDNDRFYAIKSDFQLMTDYWKRGYKDPQLSALFQTLLQRLYVLWGNVSKNYSITHSSFLSSVYMHVKISVREWAPQMIREEMESFVSEIAVLELEPAHIREFRRQELYRHHQYQMNLLFDYIWTDGMWTDGQAAAMEEILLLPTIDTNDQQLLVSSIMLAAMEMFDMAKFRTLVNVYQKAVDEKVRQRALVGWVFARNSAYSKIYPEQVQLIENVLEDKRCCNELVELQKQMVFCNNTEKDNRTIQQEIMPDLLKNQNFRMTRNGLEEVEEDSIEDILHPDEQERKLEQVEKSFQRMVSMQKQGSDIYFGGFSQMKRFPFFNEICNWFVPFYLEHPAISGVVSQHQNNKFLQAMVNNVPFCDSDKYSFAFAFQQVVDQLPQSLRSMLERGEAQLNEMATEEMTSTAYIRRIYLQDVYRFFRLFPQKSAFVNPFDEENSIFLFCADSLFSSTHLESSFHDVVAFLLKQKRIGNAAEVLKNYGEARRDFQFWMMAGYVSRHTVKEHHDDDSFDEEVCYHTALEMQPDNERALHGYASALFAKENYAKSKIYYEKLLTVNPDKMSYRLNYAACLTNLGEYENAQKELYRLNYEYPEAQNVNRVLAWTLVCDEKYERAEKIYNQLLSEEHPQSADLLNYGYCLWISGNVDEAVDCFHRFLKETGEHPSYIIENERELLEAKGITEPEMQMMLYVL